MKEGQQLAQSNHSIARFAYEKYDSFKTWIENSEYVVCLSANTEEHLDIIYQNLINDNAIVVAFREPDLGGELTSICYYGTPEMRKHTNKLQLALKPQLV